LDHVNDTPESPLSYFTGFRGLSSVFQKLVRGEKLVILQKLQKLVARMMSKIGKNGLI